MAELPEDLLTVIKKRWAEMKEEEHRSEPKKNKKLREPDVKTAIVINVANITGYVLIVESKGKLSLSG